MMATKRKKQLSDGGNELAIEEIRNIQVQAETHSDVRVKDVGKKKNVGRPENKKRIIKDGKNKGGRPRIVDTEKMSRWSLSRSGYDLAEKLKFDVKLLQAALKASMKKKREEEKLLQDKQPCAGVSQVSNTRDISRDEESTSDATERDVMQNVLQNVTDLHPAEGEEDSDSGPIGNLSRHSPESAANLYLAMDLSKRNYVYLSKDLRSRNCNVLPCYDIMREALQKCLPEKSVASEIEVRCSLQDMLNVTGPRLVLVLVLYLGWTAQDIKNLILSVNWGFDSSAGHGNPHQKCEDKANETKSAQNSLLVTSMTILEMRSLDTGKIWLNPTPQSTRFCRTLRLSIEKETNEAIISEFKRMEDETNSLAPCEFKTENDEDVKISFHVDHTLFDGKVINTLVGNSSTLRCPMCFNSQKEVKELTSPCQAKEEYFLKFGPTLLHTEIKMFEQLLRLGYLMVIKATGKKTQEQKDDLEENTDGVQQKIYDEFGGVRPDQVLQGHGTTNTGNLARRCFADPQKFAKCLGVDQKLVESMALALQLAKCRKPLKIDKYKKLCHDTHDMFFELHPWALMNPTTHRFLMHSWEVAQVFPLPLAYYAEDAPESCHKHHRRNLVVHARQISREAKLSDAFDRGNYMSDPLISLEDIEFRMALHKDHDITPEMREYIIDS